MNNNELLNNAELLDFVKKLINVDQDIYLIGHINTDYDSIGSCCCLAYALDKIGKNVKVVIGKDAKRLLENENITYFNKFLTNKIDNENKSYCCILMDMNSSYRAGEFEQYFLNASVKVNIDHHNNNVMPANFKFVDSKSGANCENVLKIILIIEKMFNIKILNKDVCKMLSFGIITDTSNIVNSSNINQTKWAVNILKEYNLDLDKIADKIYYSLNQNQQVVLKHALSNKKEFNNLSYYGVCDSNFKTLDLIHNDYTKVLSHILKEDNNTIVIFEQKFDDHSVWEFRSSDVDNYPVNLIALELGGGGHKNASGATITKLTTEQVINQFLNYFNLQEKTH